MLTGLRGLAVLLVVGAHLAPFGLPLGGGGRLGVWLFFCLSGFLLTYPFLQRSFFSISSKDWLKYAARRLIRIYPMYSVVLLIQLLTNYRSGEEALNHFLMKEGFGVFWTIPIEFKYYFIIPVVVFVILVVLRKSLLCAFLLISAVFLAHHFVYPNSFERYPEHKFLLWLPDFLAGSLVALVQVKIDERKLIDPKKNWRLFDVIGLIVFLLIALSYIPFQSFYSNITFLDYLSGTHLIKSLLWAGLICSLVNGRFLKKVFETRFMVFFGNISFSLYLTHRWIINLITQDVTWTGINFVKAVCLFLLSGYLGWRLIEKPAYEFAKKHLS